MKLKTIGIFRLWFFCLFLFYMTGVNAQMLDSMRYRRASLVTMMIEHPMNLFNAELVEAFKSSPMPERFNDHNLGVRVVRFATQEYYDQTNYIEQFIQKVKLGNRVVAKWFNWNKADGSFNINLVRKRGLYDATFTDYAIVKHTMRGKAILEDAGENLIQQTYLVMNDICFKGCYGIHESDNNVVGTKKEFDVDVTSYLFQLKWSADSMNTFIHYYWPSTPNFVEKSFPYSFNFRAKVTTKYKDSSSSISQDSLIKRAVARCLDLNIAKLQKAYPKFRIKVRLLSTNPLMADVGLKENITEKSVFEVLECVVDDNGVESFERVGLIRPRKGKICDNRYMSDTEQFLTVFDKIKGANFYPGMLIREIDDNH